MLLVGSAGFFWGAAMFSEPANQVIAWGYFANTIFWLCGFGFLLWGLKTLFQSKKDKSVPYKEGQALKTSGAKITASIAHLQQITNIRINNRSPFYVHSR